MSFWSPYDSKEEEEEAAAALRSETMASLVAFTLRETQEKYIRDSYLNCKHENETRIEQEINGETVTFMHCNHCANERETVNG